MPGCAPSSVTPAQAAIQVFSRPDGGPGPRLPPMRVSLRTFPPLLVLAVRESPHNWGAFFCRKRRSAQARRQAVFCLETVQRADRPPGRAFSAFRRVLIEDSSSLALPPELSSYYPGTGNQNGKNAQAKMQAVLDVKSRSYVRFSLSPFTRNDQTAAADVLDLLEPGDLIVRDLGYFAFKVLAHISMQTVSLFRAFPADALCTTPTALLTCPPICERRGG